MLASTPIDVAQRAERVQERLKALGALTEGRIDRPGWSPAETAAHELVAGWMREAGLEVFTDSAGNLHGLRAGAAEGASEVWTGSHLDTVPDGGMYDGSFGVLAALEAVDMLGQRPLGAAVIAWRDEEGTRFGLGCNGARALTGALSPEHLALTDADGITLAQAIASVGAAVGHGWAMTPPVAFVEAHVELATLLDTAGLSTAVVTGSVARIRMDVTIEGVAGHASIPLDKRHDAGVAGAQLVVDLRALALAQPSAVATVGGFTLTPNARNVIPERAELFLDMRAPSNAALDAMIAEFREKAEATAAAQGCTVRIVVRQHEPAIVFDEHVSDVVRAHVDPAAPALPTWGGHDALIVAKGGVPTAMMYVASANDGAAHNPLEYTETPVVADAIAALHGVLAELTSG